MNFKMLTFDRVSFSYGKKQVIDNLSFSVAPGECVVLWGGNGVGKSTVLALGAGVLSTGSGSITRGGKVGYVPQGSALPEDMTVSECLRFFARLNRCEIPRTLPFSLETMGKKRIAALSGGMKKQVSIAVSLLGDPSVLLLDEPSAALDLGFRDEMIRGVMAWKAAGKAVLYVSHDPGEFHGFFDTLVILGKTPSVLSRDAIGEDAADPLRFAAFCKNLL